MTKRKKKERTAKELKKLTDDAKETPTFRNSRLLGNAMWRAWCRCAPLGLGCGELALEWAAERFYGELVRQHLKTFEQLWSLLNEHGYTSRKKALVCGDIDNSVWAESVKNSCVRVVIDVRHCWMADDNTTIYIDDSLGLPKRALDTFRVVRVWPRQKRGYYGVDEPSVQTYRREGFKFGYGDGRDPGHVLKYDYFRNVVEHAMGYEYRILRALNDLTCHLDCLQEELQRQQGEK